MEGVVIRPRTPADDPALIGLFAQTFHKSLPLATYRWKLDFPENRVPNVFVAEHQDRIIFHYAGIPRQFVGPNGPCQAMISVDTMTHPEYRRRGLLTQVGQYTYRAWAEAKVQFVLGLPNQQWGSRTRALGWQPAGDFKTLIADLNPVQTLLKRWAWGPKAGLNLGKLFAKVFIESRHFQVEPLTEPDDRLDGLWHRLAPDNGWAGRRDNTWISHRYLDAPLPYQVWVAKKGPQWLGYAVYRRPQEGLAQLVDLWFPRPTPEVGEALLATIFGRAHQEGAEKLQTQVLAGSWLEGYLRRHFFWRGREVMGLEAAPLLSGWAPPLGPRAEGWLLPGDFDLC